MSDREISDKVDAALDRLGGPRDSWNSHFRNELKAALVWAFRVGAPAPAPTPTRPPHAL